MKNVIFSIFRYKLSTLPATEVKMDWADGLVRPENYQSLEDYFEALLPPKGEQLPVYDKGRTARANTTVRLVADDTTIAQDRKDYHRSDIIAHKDRITVLTIQANGSKQVTDRNNISHKMPHYPSTCVAIDNRPGHQIIAIAHAHQSSAMEPHRIVRLLLNHFNAQITQVGVQIEIKELTRVPEFFEACSDIIYGLKDEVLKMELSFPSDSRHKIKSVEPDLQCIRLIQDWLSTFSKRAHLSAMVRDNQSFMSPEVRKTWAFIADVCMKNRGYYLRVKFQNFGWFQYGQETVAQYGIEKDSIDYFTGEKIPIKNIFEDHNSSTEKKDFAAWLSNIVNLIELYDERSISRRKAPKSYSSKPGA